MNISQLMGKYSYWDNDLDRPVLTNVVILNASTGMEALKLSKAFNMNHSSLLLRNGPDELYVSIIKESKDEAPRAFCWTGEGKPFGINSFYYPDVADALEEMYETYPHMLESLHAVSNVDVEEMYDLFGMNYEKKELT